MWRTGVKLWGLNGATRVIYSASELRELLKTVTLAAYVYVYVWIPILPNAPWFPFAMVATDNKFDHAWCLDKWKIIWKGCAENGLLLAGHISDGDARLRKLDFGLNNATNSCQYDWYRSHYFLKHSLLMLSVPTTTDGLSLFAHQDYMHLAWRLRVQLLSPKKEWEIGPGLRVGVAHLDSLFDPTTKQKMLNGKDLDPHNKQHWAGVLKMFTKTTSDELKRRIDENSEFHLRATYAVLVVFTAYLDSWLRDRDDDFDPLQSVENAAFVLSFVMHWRYHVVSTPGLDLKSNFLTRETFLDIVTSCHGCILRFPQFRDNWDGKFKPDGPRFSSAYCEYVFQYGRMAQTNSPVVSVLGWFRHLKHYLFQQWMEAESSFSLPKSCRGIPHSIERVKIPEVPKEWHPTDEKLVAAIDRGIARAVALLQSCGVNTQSAKLKGFFKRPHKHYPLTDTFVSAAACPEADTGGKEDDPEGEDGGDGVTAIDAQDTADAEAVMAQLLRQGLPEADRELQTDEAGKELVESVQALLTSFNQSIQEESKDRKYRFVVKRLMKAHQRHGETLDEELDFYRDDDDVAVLFYEPNGTKIWCLGNIEEVAVARGTVDERRALAGTGASYLLGLEKDYKPKGVFVDDSKGMFILRWYKEVDKYGKPLSGYQNPECAAYQLTLDNDGAPFQWTPNVQLISKVYLKKHLSQPRTYNLNKKDAKMVRDSMRARESP